MKRKNAIVYCLIVQIVKYIFGHLCVKLMTEIIKILRRFIGESCLIFFLTLTSTLCFFFLSDQETQQVNADGWHDLAIGQD